MVIPVLHSGGAGVPRIRRLSHLLIPVVTDPKKAAGSLQWAVTEMMRRYKTMSDAGVRDLESFNRIVESAGRGDPLPQIVVII